MSSYSVKFICVQYNRGWTCLDPHTLVYGSWSWDQEILGTNVKSYKWEYGHGRMGVQTLVIIYNITSVVSLLYSSDSRKCMSPLMSVGILYVPHQALYSNITKINKILADARRKRLIRFTMVNNYDCTVVLFKIIQSHIIPYWIAFDDVFMVLYI